MFDFGVERAYPNGDGVIPPRASAICLLLGDPFGNTWFVESAKTGFWREATEAERRIIDPSDILWEIN